MRIQNGVLLTMEGQQFERGFVDVENGVITAVGAMSDAPGTVSGDIIDAQGGYILPGLIDAHTHIGICEEGLRWEGDDCNEATDPVTPEMRAVDGFYPFDTAIAKAVRGGVTSCAVSPGSANVIGGQICYVKLAGTNARKMVVKAPSAMKFALGENPKRCYGERKGKTPLTRMASAALIRDALTKAEKYLAKKNAGEDVYDARWEALALVLTRKIPAQFHAHRSDDILTAVNIAEEFNLDYTIIHATEAALIPEEIRAAGILPIVGPSMGPSSKPETRHGGFHVAGELYRHGIEVTLTTDHDVQPLWHLPAFAGMCVREGLPEDAALRAITINAAKAAHMDQRVGSLKVGKDADIAVFTGHPFDYRSKACAVLINGIRVV